MINIPDYNITSKLFESDCTEIFRGKDLKRDLSIILKILKAEQSIESSELNHEYKILSILSNISGIANVYQRGIFQNRPYLVMEDILGESLKNRIYVNKIDLSDILLIAIEIIRAIGNIHEKNIIHKDISSSNIIINQDLNTVNIIDFGISTQLSIETPNLMTLNTLEGNLKYISPEQTGRINRALDYRTDYYSFGVCLFEMLTQKLPFDFSDPMEMVHSHIAKTPKSPHEIDKTIPSALSEIVMKLLAKNAENRYQSSSGIISDLNYCLTQYQANGAIDCFTAGQNDIPEKFKIPQKLYGRDNEIDLLMKSFNSASQKNAQLLMVSGYSGIGKTALVKQIFKPVQELKGYFISGKFDQFQRNMPYKAIVEAFQELIKLLLIESEEKLMGWKNTLLEVLGPNAQIIIDVIPDLALIIGDQPEVPELPPVEAKNRFNYVFQNFIHTFTKKTHPLVLFLDDLQWADEASLNLIQMVLRDKDHCLLLIGSYRNNEVDQAHPLIKTLEEIKQNNVVYVHELFLAPINVHHIQQIIIETLFCQKDPDSKSLAELILAKTGGNPFFINEFLKTLYSKNLIYFNKSGVNEDQAAAWQWDLAAIKNQGITENVVELMSEKISAYSDDIQKTLSLAACIGNRFDLKTLSIVNEKSVIITSKMLIDPISSELLICLDDINKMVKAADDNSHEIADMRFKFSHDRIQQAAYSFIDKSSINALHYKIGQLILQSTPKNKIGESLFEIVDHLNHGLDIITQQDKRFEMADLNLQAGIKARASAAYQPAYEYFMTGLKLLQKNCWNEQYELTLSLHIQGCESAYLTGDFDTMERISAIVLDSAVNETDKTKIYIVKILAYTAQNRPLDAAKVAISSVNRLGVKISQKTNKLKILNSLIKTKLCLKGKDIQNIAKAPVMTDPMLIAANNILSIAGASVYQALPELYAMIVFQRVRMSVKYGNSPASSTGFASYGIVLSGILGDVESAYRFGNLAFQMNELFNAKEFETRIIFIFNFFIRPWKEHLKNSLDPLETGFKVGMETGDFEYAAYCITFHFIAAFFAGNQLSALKEKMLIYEKQIEFLNQSMPFNRFCITMSTIQNLIENRENPSVLCDSYLDEHTIIPILKNGNDMPSLSGIFCFKLFLSVIFNEVDISVKISQSLSQYIGSTKSSYNMPMYYFYDSLAHLSIFEKSHQKKKKQILKKITANQKKIKKWAKHAPMNFLNKYYLVEAEKCSILGKDTFAIDYYEKAIQSSSDNGFIHEEGLASELCGKFWITKGNDSVAAVYIQRSYRAFKNWGALNKLRNLEKKYPNLLKNNQIYGNIYDHTITHTIHPNQSGHSLLDLNTVFKSSQAISQEIVLSDLLKKLMIIVKENAGAEKGLMILENNKTFCVVFQSFEDNQYAEDVIPVNSFAHFPKTVFQYVARTSEHVVLTDACNEGMFMQDPYILSNQTKSILCSPIIHQNVLTGAIYLENNQTKAAFTSDRVEMIMLLSSQAAISIQNAKFYMDMKAAEEKYRGIFENSMEGIFRSTPDGRFIDANPSMARIFGYQSPEEMKDANQNFATQCYANPEDRNRFINEILTNGIVEREEGEFLRRDGSTGWGIISARAIRDKDDNIGYFEGSFNDITEKKEKEQADRKREIIEAINEKIMESIRYAKMIQSSLLPDQKLIEKLIPKSFFLYQPKDIVGGDIYFVEEIDGGFILAVIDCTGHGVPGAFMTMIACSALKRIVTNENISDPAVILQKLNVAVKTTLHQDTEHALSDDGMDIAICTVHKEENQLIFAGAKLPLFYVLDNQIHLIKPDRQSIGYKESKHAQIDFTYNNHVIDIQKDHTFYLATDGYQDQLGGTSHKRFGKNRLKNTLIQIHHLDMEKQKQHLQKTFHDFCGDNDVQDDCTIAGFTL
jgi:PAS domain S-box-containing protein